MLRVPNDDQIVGPPALSGPSAVPGRAPGNLSNCHGRSLSIAWIMPVLSRAGLFLQHLNYNVPPLATRFDVPVSLGNLLQPEAPVNDRLKFAGLQQVFEVGQFFSCLF